ncbi:MULTISPECIES: AAA family ATPase [unclassified Pseudomonas]|jgi:SpoVK/Ycf46/Vps4 family AAA+-type ATPase|uniref:AAA family ATPase n=1 Tax=Pseudomonas TaxID=286 RepID=UPI000CC51DFE|nr:MULTISPECIES: AAA family ATPase [unclassified Pseudomonas]PKM27406.1 MAG: ATPase [Gammaproteobacteria bacterium HGW-Gammaproteobacteria-13]MCR4508051.1 AAA family ATPase [Pseudomonas sp. 32.2.56]MDP2243156.1 AAA family ATPase [Pseudomonas sp.]MDP2745436.1 AAA family ATPase [Pseudomonas sp.]NMY53284.1 ATP-binding protein [Pseudomonas sp. WS 5011]|tara:strand:- start:3933 stop:4916 length:984 start_codon:yes stop_codon:yes gene_type:complete
MASGEQLKALLRSHIKGDDTHFLAVAMQMAAHEAKQGHGKLAEDLRAIIDSAKKNRLPSGQPVPIGQPRGELSNLLSVALPKTRFSEMILDEATHARLGRIINEQRNFEKIRAHGLSPRRKLLLVGPPGTGKTMTASALAGELGIPLYIVRLDSLITKYMGETAAKLRQIFDAIRDTRGIYFFDEFDAIGSQRGLANDVGEIRRVLNSFLQMIEQDQSNSLIIAATNHPEILDYALFRRFDDVIEYGLPNQEQTKAVLKNRLANFSKSIRSWDKLCKVAEGLSHAELARAADDAIKDTIIHDRTEMAVKDVERHLEERKTFHGRRHS